MICACVMEYDLKPHTYMYTRAPIMHLHGFVTTGHGLACYPLLPACRNYHSGQEVGDSKQDYECTYVLST